MAREMLLAALACWSVAGLSSTATLRLLDGTAKAQHVPLGFAKGWSTWVLDGGALVRVEDDGDYVNPVSFDELWYAKEQPAPAARLALGLHLRNGEIRHFMPAVDVFLETPTKRHRNRGLCSVPRANTWLSLGGYGASALRLTAFDGETRLTGENGFDVRATLAFAIETALASDELLTGSHVVTIPLLDIAPLPDLKIESRLRVVLADFVPQHVGDLLSPDLALLDVTVRETELRSDFDVEDIPEVYKDLYCRWDLMAKVKEPVPDSE
ncbi:hypothetical protein M885DRAFT_525692 [Pelagophyceae sp. CCMP2097]|nr:hypothetical protein M885DRAFT_525692 [Pelagophyceae sp. CCMP2097]